MHEGNIRRVTIQNDEGKELIEIPPRHLGTNL